MRSERIHTLILGAGPAGLAAGYELAKAGIKPAILEKEKECGGLMRSIRHGDFILDIGRKELYNRFQRVDKFWENILGSDYRVYEHRGGILYKRQILDMTSAYRGFRRGLSWGMFISCAFDFLWWRAKFALRPKAKNLEEFWYRQRGRRLTRLANQGFQEKLNGKKWAEIPMTEAESGIHGAGFLQTIKHALTRAFWTKETCTYKNIWRHPARGTGQICELLERRILEKGGCIHCHAAILEMHARRGTICAVTVRLDRESVVYQPENVVSSAPLEFLDRLLLKRSSQSLSCSPSEQGSKSPRRTVVLVYLFADEKPRFPQFYLHVTCPDTRIGRITNYAATNSEMVPPGKTCLCCEIYCYGDDPLLNCDDTEIAKQVLRDCAESKLLDAGKCFDHLVLRLPGADPSQNRHNWMNPSRRHLLEELRQFRNLYCISRTDLDISTLAGLEAADAIITGNRTGFDQRVDPDCLEDRSEPKPFEFRHPPGVQTQITA
jgi:protoporphyrinogen oxidase